MLIGQINKAFKITNHQKKAKVNPNWGRNRLTENKVYKIRYFYIGESSQDIADSEAYLFFVYLRTFLLEIPRNLFYSTGLYF